MGALWGGVFAGWHFLRRRDSQAEWIIFAAVLSHWVADYLMHKPDMQLAPGLDRYFGLGLWTSIPTTLVVEGSVWLVGIVMYCRATTPKNRIGTLAYWSIIVLLTYIWLLAPFTPLPTDISADDAVNDLKTFNLIFLILLVMWSYWINWLRLPTNRAAKGRLQKERLQNSST